ncbi:hypothetical protein H4R33_007157, partial [Dimargaris cristalligena]
MARILSSLSVASKPAPTDALANGPANGQHVVDKFAKLDVESLGISPHPEPTSNSFGIPKQNTSDDGTEAMARILSSLSVASKPAPTDAPANAPTNTQRMVDQIAENYADSLVISPHPEFASNGREMSIHNTPNDDTEAAANHIFPSSIASEPAPTDALANEPANAERLVDQFPENYANSPGITPHPESASNGLEMSIHNTPNDDTEAVANHISSSSIESEPARTDALVSSPANAQHMVDLFANLLAMSSRLLITGNGREMVLLKSPDGDTITMANHFALLSVATEAAPTGALTNNPVNANRLVGQFAEYYADLLVISSHPHFTSNSLEMFMPNTPDNDTIEMAIYLYSLTNTSELPPTEVLVGSLVNAERLVNQFPENYADSPVISPHPESASNGLEMSIHNTPNDDTEAATNHILPSSIASEPAPTDALTNEPANAE